MLRSGKIGSAVDDELGDGVLLALPPDAADYFFILNKGQKQLNELGAIRRGDGVQNLGDKIPEMGPYYIQFGPK